MASLPDPVAGLTFRASTREDAEAVHALMLACYAVDEPQERETVDAFLQLPAPQRKLIREVILTFAKVHSPDASAPADQAGD